MTVISDFWSPTRWTRDYGWRPSAGESNPYTLGYHIGQDIAGGSWYGDIPALRPGKVVRVGRSSVIGGYVVIEADADGRFDGYAHLNSAPNSRPAVGERVSRGQSVGKLARSTLPWAGDDYTGSGSTGPHLHFTISYKADNSWNPVKGYDLDPRPFIRSAVLGPDLAGGGSTPFDPLEIEMDWETFKNFAWRYDKFHARDGGIGLGGNEGPTLWERVNFIRSDVGGVRGVVDGLVSPIAKLIKRTNLWDETADGGWFPFRDALSRWLTYHSRADGPTGKGPTLHEHMSNIEAAIAANGTVRVQIDHAALVQALSDPKVASAISAPILAAIQK